MVQVIGAPTMNRRQQLTTSIIRDMNVTAALRMNNYELANLLKSLSDEALLRFVTVMESWSNADKMEGNI